MGKPKDFFEFYDEDDVEEPYPGFGPAAEDAPAEPGGPDLGGRSQRRKGGRAARALGLAAAAAAAIGVALVATRGDPGAEQGSRPAAEAPPPIVSERDGRSRPGVPRSRANPRAPDRMAEDRVRSRRRPGRSPERAGGRVARDRAPGSAGGGAAAVTAPAPATTTAPAPVASPAAPTETVRDATAADVVQAIGP